MRPLAARHFHALLLAVRAGQFDDRATCDQCTAAAAAVAATAHGGSADASAGVGANNGTSAGVNASANASAADASTMIAQVRASHQAIIATNKTN
jgi:hypothetical protein